MSRKARPVATQSKEGHLLLGVLAPGCRTTPPLRDLRPATSTRYSAPLGCLSATGAEVMFNAILCAVEHCHVSLRGGAHRPARRSRLVHSAVRVPESQARVSRCPYGETAKRTSMRDRS